MEAAKDEMKIRLIELLKSPLQEFDNPVAYWCDEHIEAYAAMLMAHGVTVQSKASEIAQYIIRTGTENTTSGNWYVSFDEIEDQFGVNLASDVDLLDRVCECLFDAGDVVAEFDVYDDEFDMMFYTDYCINYEDDDDEDF